MALALDPTSVIRVVSIDEIMNDVTLIRSDLSRFFERHSTTFWRSTTGKIGSPVTIRQPHAVKTRTPGWDPGALKRRNNDKMKVGACYPDSFCFSFGILASIRMGGVCCR